MSRFKNQKTFEFDKWKRVFCRNCGDFLCESHLTDETTKVFKCGGCKNIQVVAPVRLGVFNNQNGYYWCEPNDSCFTAVAD